MSATDSFLPRRAEVVCGLCGQKAAFATPYLDGDVILVSVVCPRCGVSLSAVLEVPRVLLEGRA
jgi:hypothetical protein